MATEIKAIQCPKCGSTQKTEVRPGDFKCLSCGTEYFLDNGAVNFSTPPPPPQPPPTGGAFKIIAVFGAIIFIAVMLITGIVTFSSPGSTTTSGGSSSTSAAEYDVGLDLIYASADKRPILLADARRDENIGSSIQKNFIVFFDAAKGVEITRTPLPGAETTDHFNTSNSTTIKGFSNGDIYILVNYTVLSVVHSGGFRVVDVSKSLFKGHPELSSGIGKIDFTDNDKDKDGLRLITNDGKSYLYFPISDSLYTKDSFSKREASDDSERTGFDFNNTSHYDIADEATAQLIKYRYKGRKGSMEYYVEQLARTHDTAGIQREGRLISAVDFTPGRNYFGMAMLYYDEDYVLISYKITPVQKSQRFIQCLNARTGAIVFTTALNTEDYPPEQAIRYTDGFAMMMRSNTIAYTVSLSGKLHTYKPSMSDKN